MTFLFALSVVQGQTQKSGLKKLEGKTVSQTAKNNFNADFGNLPNVQWKRIETFDETSFIKDGKEMKDH